MSTVNSEPCKLTLDLMPIVIQVQRNHFGYTRTVLIIALYVYLFVDLKLY